MNLENQYTSLGRAERDQGVVVDPETVDLIECAGGRKE